MIVVSLIFQIVLAYILGFMMPFFFGIGDGAENYAIPLGMAVGIWLGGWIGSKITKEAFDQGGKRFIFSLIGAALGQLIINFITLGFLGLLVPMVLGVVGFYLVKK